MARKKKRKTGPNKLDLQGSFFPWTGREIKESVLYKIKIGKPNPFSKGNGSGRK